MVTGRLTADPEIQTKGESRLCKFTIACDRPKRKDEENPETDFFQCIAWNRNADVIVDWFHSKNDNSNAKAAEESSLRISGAMTRIG